MQYQMQYRSDFEAHAGDSTKMLEAHRRQCSIRGMSGYGMAACDASGRSPGSLKV
jgi:hypothetical protein